MFYSAGMVHKKLSMPRLCQARNHGGHSAASSSDRGEAGSVV